MTQGRTYCGVAIPAVLALAGAIAGFGMDVGDQDGLRTIAGKLHEIFDSCGLSNSFEIYHGTHTSAVADRFQNHVMPFFSKNLCFTSNCP